ncbi:MAG: ABC transporter permease, partial [Abditibacteriales bacterium]|nr:ABC transporter permease [Abditibacteriales bacterium]MDW8367746.1 ABC transporter permease subunit [Abditibacteriales bacterium]
PIRQSLAFTICLFTLFCVLGGVSPFNRPTLVILGKVSALGAVAAAFGVAARWWQRRVAAARPLQEEAETPTAPWAALAYPQSATYDHHSLWFSNAAKRVTWFLFFLVWVYPFVALLSDHPLVQRTAAVSPFLSLASLSPRLNEFLQGITILQFAPTPPWWTGLLMQPAAALLWCALALRLHPRHRQILAGAQDVNTGWWARLTARVRTLNDRLIERLSDAINARFDNPVAVKEVRVRARRENWAAQQIAIFFIAWLLVLISACLLLWKVMFAPAPPTKFLLTTWLAPVCPELGTLSIPAQVSLSIIIPLWMLEWIVVWIMTIQPGTAFDGERTSGTLGFLLTTPLRERDILLGKWIGFTADRWLSFAFSLPPTVLLVLLITLSGAPQVLPLFIGFTLFLASMLLGGAMLAVALSARAQARGAGVGWSLLVLATLQIPVLVSLMHLASFQSPLVAYTLPFLFGAALHAAIGALGLADGSRVLHRLRIGDVAFEGQRWEN